MGPKVFERHSPAMRMRRHARPPIAQ